MTDPEQSSTATAAEVVERAAEAYSTLAELAETIEDEWQYVTDLVDLYLPGIRSLAEPVPRRVLAAAQVAAVDEAIAEIGLITDPHRAIDWLSTFPHVVGLALGGDVDGAAGEGARGGGAAGRVLAADADDDSPFGALRGFR
ncbi:MAG TPA: hypothetical protein VF375_07550 [Candidatus Limnocylindrales bacterium]